jgi:hypothetical protein
MEKGVTFGVCDSNGEGIGLLYDPIKASGYEFERSPTSSLPVARAIVCSLASETRGCEELSPL